MVGLAMNEPLARHHYSLDFYLQPLENQPLTIPAVGELLPAYWHARVNVLIRSCQRVVTACPIN